MRAKPVAGWFFALGFVAMQGMGQEAAAPGMAPPFQQGGLRLGVGVGALTGTTSFEIGGKYTEADGSVGQLHFPISRLEYPLDVVMATAEGSFAFGDKWSVGAKAGKNVTTDAGKSNDSDWLIPGSLDAYSESDTELDALLLEFNVRYRVLDRANWSCLVGGGYVYQSFDTEDSNLVQWSPSGLLGSGVYTDTGLNATYDITYSIPYLEAVAQGRFWQRVTVEARIGYAPAVTAEDEGHWMLRNIRFEGDCDGQALLFSIQGRWDFSERWFAAASVDITTITTDGTATSFENGAYTHEIDRETESEQAQFALQVGRTF